jgi:hypothetical protein
MAFIEKAIRECQEGSPPPFIGHWPRFSKPKNLARHMMYVSSAGSFLGWLAAILLL